MNKNSAPTEVDTPNDNQTETRKHRIVLVDDHPITRKGIAALINQERDLAVCGETDSALSAIDIVNAHKPDLVIVDVALRSVNGIELIKNLKTLEPTLPILMLSMYDESLYAERALRAGAQGYVMKREASEKIVVAIRQVMRGELYVSDSIKEKMVRLAIGHRRNQASYLIDTLSDREIEVIELIGTGFSTRQIASRLNLSVKTIDSYREHLKTKLQLKSGPDLLRYAIQWVNSEGNVTGTPPAES